MPSLVALVPVCALGLQCLAKYRRNMAQKLCSAATDAMERIGDTADDCTLVAMDGSTYRVSKAITALHSRVLGCASTRC
jgi:6,7-dimethyl-8-ribityllumazine synthase